MTWVCPTFQRPERLAELAESWEKHETGTPLMVRVWDQDPRKEDYFKITWPKGWELYESPARGAGEALNEYFRMNPNEQTYGFIGDDVVLRTPQGLELLDATAYPWFLAYPNDTIQRHMMCTHFSLGGEFARTIATIVPPMFKHTYMDVGLWHVAAPMNLTRYCPHVVFQHMHFLRKRYGIERDATYQEVYPQGDAPSGPLEDQGQAALKLFEAVYQKKAVERIAERIYREYECWDKWEGDDVLIHRRAG